MGHLQSAIGEDNSFSNFKYKRLPRKINGRLLKNMDFSG
jgi:hypothetical protein